MQFDADNFKSMFSVSVIGIVVVLNKFYLTMFTCITFTLLSVLSDYVVESMLSSESVLKIRSEIQN